MPGGSAVPRAKMSWTSGHPSAPAVGAGPLVIVATDTATATTRPKTDHLRRRIRRILTYTGTHLRGAKPDGPTRPLAVPRKREVPPTRLGVPPYRPPLRGAHRRRARLADCGRTPARPRRPRAAGGTGHRR